ncbi:MAG: hypothetical protein OHK0046_26580 [Anaerolineae bacterium]
MPKRLLFVVILLFLVLLPVHAQQTTVAISIPAGQEDLYDTIIADFEAEFPNIDVRVVSNPFDFAAEEPETIEEQLDEYRTEATKADVLIVDNSTLTVEATRAGYFLDITPLIQVDPSLNEDDFYRAMWESFQWDGGIWALPYEGDVTVLLYDPVMFDEAGVLYPTESWSLIELEQAIRDLTEYDDAGNVERSAVLDLTDNAAIYAIMVSVLGEGVYDDFEFLSTPDFSSTLLEDLMTLWADLTRDGLLGVNPGGFTEPILIAPSFITAVGQVAEELEIIALPGGRPDVQVNAVAISAGTRSPEAAYELAKFLTYNEDLVEDGDIIPARSSLSEGAGLAFSELDPNTADIILDSLDNALSIADLRFTSDVQEALNRMIADNIDARTALNAVEAEVVERLQAADARFGTEQITIQQPEEIVLAPGEIAINFGVSSLISPLLTQEQWDDLIAQFEADDPEVGRVLLDVRQEFFNVDIAGIAEQYDCFYLPDNEVQSADLSVLLSLTPLLASDPFFDQSDFVGDIFSEVQRENQTWALPLVVQPEVMFYNVDQFNLYGVRQPQAGWSVPEFEDALVGLRITDEDPTPFVPQNLGGTYIQVLLAAYGGLLLDYRTEPPTLNYDDPAVLEAAIEVLNLAKEGYIQYDGLTENLGFNVFGEPTDDPVAILNRLLNPVGDFLPSGTSADANTRLISFPQGAQLNAVSYDLGTAYISAQTQHADACYRFIRALSDEAPRLFGEMPARRSQINSQTVVDEQGPDAAAFYTELDRLMQQPTTVLIPTPLSLDIGTVQTYLTALWVYRAFDRYVFEDADLELELQDAQRYSDEFLTCAETIPPVNPVEDEDFQQYGQQVLACATDADPTFIQLLGFGRRRGQ